MIKDFSWKGRPEWNTYQIAKRKFWDAKLTFLYLYQWVSFQLSIILSPLWLYSGNKLSKTSITGMEFILSIVSNVSLREYFFLGCGFSFTIRLGSTDIFNFHSHIASFTSLHQHNASRTSYKCKGVYGILFILSSAGKSLSTKR